MHLHSSAVAERQSGKPCAVPQAGLLGLLLSLPMLSLCCWSSLASPAVPQPELLLDLLTLSPLPLPLLLVQSGMPYSATGALLSSCFSAFPHSLCISPLLLEFLSGC